ncbi:DNRLRE domain-containing protein [candidate division WOR-3 bacterium]|nr:DNRLRE domain-containing protein [candidate division WOR-3 bacterium]
MNILKILFAITSVLFFPVEHSLNSQTIEPIYDMFTDPDHATGHPVGELWVADYAPLSNYQRIMIMFDLSAYTGGKVDSAFLNLDRFFGCPSGTPTNVKLYAITETWNESWPENVHISHGTTEWASYSFIVNGWHRIDITSLVNSWLDESVANYGLVLRGLSGSKWSKFYSREASPGFCPYLELVNYTGVDESQGNISRIIEINAYPNPFYSHCQITVPEVSSIEIVALDGRVIYGAENFRGNFTWKPSESEKSGVYFVRALSNGQNFFRKITYIK